MREAEKLDALLAEIRACRVCDLPHEPRPVVRVRKDARILIAGQAPGRLVHETGLPWNDPAFGIPWPTPAPFTSARDQSHAPFAAFQTPFVAGIAW